MKILLATDGSPCSQAAIEELARLSWPPQTEVRLITVDTPIDPVLLRASPATVYDEIVAQQRAECARRLNEAATYFAQHAPHLLVTQTIAEGWAKDSIVSEAERWGADLVVIGSHGYGPVRRFLLGSVSQFVTQHAPCSVLVVRPSHQASTEPSEGTSA